MLLADLRPALRLDSQRWPVAAYAVAAGLASWRIAMKGNKQEARYLAAAFACIHLPAGAGMLVGLLRARLSGNAPSPSTARSRGGVSRDG